MMKKDPDQCIIKIKGLQKSYGELVAVKDLSLDIRRQTSPGHPYPRQEKKHPLLARGRPYKLGERE